MLPAMKNMSDPTVCHDCERKFDGEILPEEDEADRLDNDIQRAHAVAFMEFDEKGVLLEREARLCLKCSFRRWNVPVSEMA